MTREIGPSRPPPAHTNENDDEDPNSPSDGYFSNSSHVPSNILIPDPESSQSQSSSKAHEAESDSQSPTSYRHSEPERSSPTRNENLIYTPTSSRRSEAELTESSPLLEEPPPLYEDAVAGRPRPDNLNPTTMGYGTTQNHNVGHASFIPGRLREPQSMVDHPRNDPLPYDEETASPEQAYQTRRRWFGWRRRRDLDSELQPKRRRSLFKRVLIFLAGFLCVVWFLGLIWSNAHAQSNTEHGSGSPTNPPKYDEPKAPLISSKPTVPTPSVPSPPSNPSKPDGPSTPANPPSASAKPSPTPKNPYSDPPGKTFPPREIHVHETSSSVSGTYPLVSINIDPQPAPENAPNTTAELRISTKSGSVTLNGVKGVHKHESESSWSRWWNWGFNPPPEASSGHTGGPPSRPYKITISTGSGAVSGFMIHGQDTSITTGSGSISMSLLPVYFGESDNSTLTTLTGSGSTNLNIQRSHERSKLDTLRSRHESRKSGSINIVYPETWEGEVDISSEGSGSITAYGRGLDVIRYGHGHVIGSKGHGGSKAELIARGSGSQVFYVK